MSTWTIGPAFTGCSLIDANEYGWQTADQVATTFASPPPIGVVEPNVGNFTDCNANWVMGHFINTGGPGGPTWSSGMGAPTSVCPLSSIYSRADGDVGSTIYISRGAGAWIALAGV
jgi:hypothetical protein